MRMNIGTTVTSCGTISVPRYSRKIRSRNRKRSRANAYADSTDVTHTTTVPASATNRPLSMNRPNGR